jgi:nitroreductase
MNPTIDLIRAHRSIRRYEPTPVPDEDVRRAVEAGQAASTSSAVQAYALLRVTDGSHLERLVELTGGQAKVARCGAFFVVLGDTRRHRLIVERAGGDYDAKLEGFLLAVIDATLFAQNLCLAFESMGYGICYIGGLRNDLPEVDALLGLPEGVYPLYGLCVGEPAEDPAPRPRLPVEAVLLEDRYPADDRMLALIDGYDATYRDYLAGRGAAPRAWSEAMAAAFGEAKRSAIAAYYRSKGAELE